MNTSTFAISGVITLTVLSVCEFASAADPPTVNHASGQKLIEFGSAPSSAYLKDHIREVEKVPFDGIVLDLRKNGSNFGDTRDWFSWSDVWGTTKLREEDFSESIAEIKSIQFKRFTDNFFRFNAVNGRSDWFDQEYAVNDNIRLLARLAKQCGMKGILLDPEAYQGTPFSYAAQPRRGEHSFAEYQQKTRDRGREFIRAINAEYPDVTLFLTFGYNLSYYTQKPLDNNEYGLWPSFLDGMLEAAAPGTRIHDGWEFSYGYKDEQQFSDARAIMLKQGLQWTEVPDRYSVHYKAAFGVWVNNGRQFDANDLTKNFFTPEQFQQSVQLAMKHSDRYVWIYSENINWWGGTVPHAYVDALDGARRAGGRSAVP